MSSYLFIGLLSPGGTQAMGNLPSRGNIKTIGVGTYWDANCSDKVSSLDWGIMEPGSSKNVTFYIRNEGNADIILSLNTSNWIPPDASRYITLSWDYDGRPTHLNEALQVMLTITVSATIGDINTYTFDVQIKGTS
jgi:hypothetical protein